MFKIVTIIGARPQFIKAAAVTLAIRQINRKSNSRLKINEVILHTGQHYDYNMNDIFFKELALKKPAYNLKVGSHSHGKQTALMLAGIEDVLNKEKPAAVLVYGDTNSTLAGALAAKKLNILLSHVEAGMRSGNMNMPEEVNRIVTDRVADILFCSSRNAVKNLYKEGIVDAGATKNPRVFCVGDVMYDTVLLYTRLAEKKSEILKELSLKPKSYYLVTLHRAENTDNTDRLRSIVSGLDKIAGDNNILVFPVHPRTKKIIRSANMGKLVKNLKMISPVSYLDMLLLEKYASLILTDSGGIQKEAYFFSVPCLTLRNETEWIETVECGANIIVGADRDKIVNAAKVFSNSVIKPSGVYGNGDAGSKIARILKDLLSNA